jgi:hypothetical protein
MFDFFEGLIDFAVSATGFGVTPQQEESTGAKTTTVRRVAGPAALLLSLIFAAGTGGITERAEAQSIPTSSDVLIEVRHVKAPARAAHFVPNDQEDISVIDRLETIRNQLSLNTKQLSDAMLVGRPAVYGWLNGSTPRHGQQLRLKELYDIAREWKRANNVPIGKHLIAPLETGVSLAALLRAEVLDRARITQTLMTIGAAAHASAERRRNSGYRSVSSVMKARNIKPVASRTQQQRIDDLADI